MGHGLSASRKTNLLASIINTFMFKDWSNLIKPISVDDLLQLTLLSYWFILIWSSSHGALNAKVVKLDDSGIRYPVENSGKPPIKLVNFEK